MTDEDRKSYIAGFLMWLIEETALDRPNFSDQLKFTLALWTGPKPSLSATKAILLHT